MIAKSGALFAALLGIAVVPTAFAADAVGLPLFVIDDGATSDEAVNMIELPESASVAGHEESALGRETAYDAREMGSEFGERMSDEARAHVRDALRQDEGRRARRQPEDTGKPDNPGKPES